MADSKKVSVVGCGWLGLPLAKHLVGLGFTVKGSKTSSKAAQLLANEGIQGHHVELNPTLHCDTIRDLLDCDILVINIPPKRREDIEVFHWEQMQALNASVQQSNLKHVLFVSSTSVYPANGRIFSEEDEHVPDKPSGRVLKRIEQLWLNHENVESTVIRFGGLIGGDRHPGKFLAAKRKLKNGNAAVNLIHLDDCIGIITAIIQQNVWGQVFNACAAKHPLRRDFYKAAAEKLNLEPPLFDDEPTTEWKIIDSSKVRAALTYQWVFDDPLDFI